MPSPFLSPALPGPAASAGRGVLGADPEGAADPAGCDSEALSKSLSESSISITSRSTEAAGILGSGAGCAAASLSASCRPVCCGCYQLKQSELASADVRSCCWAAPVTAAAGASYAVVWCAVQGLHQRLYPVCAVCAWHTVNAAVCYCS